MSAEVESILRSFWEWRLRESPEFATQIGVHTFDSCLDVHSLDAYAKRKVKYSLTANIIWWLFVLLLHPRNFMDFNVKKCKIMRITKKKQPFISNFLLHNSLLEEVSEFRDLGITTDQHLCWNLHIDKVVAKANRMLGLIKRTCRDFDDHKTLRTLYVLCSCNCTIQLRILGRVVQSRVKITQG